jgi:hypothetical protein
VHDSQQLGLFGDTQAPATKARRVEYLPPELPEITEYAYAVCKAMEGENDPNFRNTEVVQGFISFMRVIVKLKTNALNQRGKHDQPQKNA